MADQRSWRLIAVRNGASPELLRIAARVYLYGMSFVTLVVAALAAERTGRLLLGAPTGQGVEQAFTLEPFLESTAQSAATGLIAGAVWLVHWRLIQWRVASGRTEYSRERASVVRKLFLYLVLYLAGFALVLTLVGLLGMVTTVALGQRSAEEAVRSIAGDVWSTILVGSVFAYHFHLAESDRRVVPELGWAATLRRIWVFALGAQALLFFFAIPAVGLLMDLVESWAIPSTATASSSAWLGPFLATQPATIIVALLTWYLLWTWNTDTFVERDQGDDERGSLLRAAYLHVLVTAPFLFAAWYLARVPFELLRMALLPERQAVGWEVVLYDVRSAMPMVLVFGAIALYHKHVVDRDVEVLGLSGLRGGLAHGYRCLLAYAGVLGIVGLLASTGILLAWAALAGAADPSNFREWLSYMGAFLTFAFLVWLGAWCWLQRAARIPAVRQSLWRRIYLLVVLASTLITVLILEASWAVLAIVFVLGAFAWVGRAEFLGSGIQVAAALFFLLYHVWVLLGDLRYARRQEPSLRAVAQA